MRKIFLLFLLTASLSACAPTKGYSGPDLPPEKISTVSIDYNSANLEYSAARIDGIEFGYSGINLLPGSHLFDISVTAKDPPFNCRTYSNMDYYGYNSCRSKQNKQCDCYDYITVYKECLREVYDGICRGEVITRAGVNYNLAIRGYRGSAEISVVPVGGYEKAGGGSCSGFSRRIETDTETIGSGRYNANSNGIYYCN